MSNRLLRKRVPLIDETITDELKIGRSVHQFPGKVPFKKLAGMASVMNFDAPGIVVFVETDVAETALVELLINAWQVTGIQMNEHT
jgi:hypothetical protein